MMYRLKEKYTIGSEIPIGSTVLMMCHGPKVNHAGDLDDSDIYYDCIYCVVETPHKKEKKLCMFVYEQIKAGVYTDLPPLTVSETAYNSAGYLFQSLFELDEAPEQAKQRRALEHLKNAAAELGYTLRKIDE